MNTQEFAEWLRGESAKPIERESNLTDYSCGLARGYRNALRDALRKLTSLDSSHDLPSTNG